MRFFFVIDASFRLEQMFEGGKGAFAEGFGGLDEHRRWSAAFWS